MKILKSPLKVFHDDQMIYEFKKDIVTATYKGKTETFDFTDMSDGIAQEIETDLEILPIISAKREDGILYLELRNLINDNATETEKFPVWEEIQFGED